MQHLHFSSCILVICGSEIGILDPPYVYGRAGALPSHQSEWGGSDGCFSSSFPLQSVRVIPSTASNKGSSLSTMFASRAIASSVLRRAAVSTTVARSFFSPLLTVSKSVQHPRISANVIVRGFMATAFSAKDGYTSIYVGGLGTEIGDADFMSMIEERGVEGCVRETNR